MQSQDIIGPSSGKAPARNAACALFLGRRRQPHACVQNSPFGLFTLLSAVLPLLGWR